ncbi:uncharacterized protein DFL_009340 [Arthrobotrys flagrans]|uniref:Uncharacterized protein n=1 Tax=Arthrobotrys flagrans TaxID=97331 RepID=A0A436ZRT9_ARTFL|nr:hypothetical protein DFL_009340 [Arthrobotrys flagrans]
MVGHADFVPLVHPTTKRPLSQEATGKGGSLIWLPTQLTSLIRDQLPISSWLALGAVLEAILFNIIGWKAFLPPALLLFYQISDTILVLSGLKRNVLMDGVLLNKYSAQFPDSQGHFGSTPANDNVVCFIIGSRANHPMGMFGPGVKTIADYFEGMTTYLDNHAEEFGYLGANRWLASDRPAKNEIMATMYFRNYEGLHKFAHDDMHRQGWNWWNKNLKNHPHIGIWHEVYVAPKGNWESIYINSAPTGLAATTLRIESYEKADSTISKEPMARNMTNTTTILIRIMAR